MKKLFCFLALTSLVLNSCSSSDSSSSSGDVLLKKTIDTYADGSVVTSTATYNGNKIDKITTDDGVIVDFTYSGDLITRIDYKFDGATYQTDKFTYNTDNNILSYVRQELNDDLGSKEVYVYNPDGTITVNMFSGDINDQNTASGVATISFQNGEVHQINDGFSTETYTYDSRNNPFMNVTGFSKISFVDLEAEGILHNVTSINSTSDSSTTTTYVYNADNYPTSAVETYDGEETATQFFYN